MPLYEVAIATPFIKTEVIEAPDAMTAARIIYNDERAVFIEVVDEHVGDERRIGHVRRHTCAECSDLFHITNRTNRSEETR